MATIVKTGVTLRKLNEHHYTSINTIHGDLHVVGHCCILWYPIVQVPWGVSHGWIDMYDPWMHNFQREGTPDCILVVPSHHIRIRRGALDDIDLERFRLAGGLIDDTPGEMG